MLEHFGNDTDSKPTRPRQLVDEDERSRIVRSRHATGGLFQGWGPKLFLTALAASALLASGNTANAADAVAARTCSTSNSPAHLVASPVFEIPYIAAEQSASGSVMLKIALSDTGQLQDAEVAESSGDQLLDNEALRVARASQYAPASRGCENTAGDYFYIVDFPSAG